MSKVKTFLEMIKFEHTLFALPFAYLGAFLASKGFPTLEKFIWITLAMIGARTAAMSLNRLIDRYIDARNPRTRERAIPAGKLGTTEVYFYTLLSFLLLGVSAYELNWLAFELMPIAVFSCSILLYQTLYVGLSSGFRNIVGISAYGGLDWCYGTLGFSTGFARLRCFILGCRL